jgi:hypothetical protein
MVDEIPQTIDEPNGQRVSGAQLYKALYEVDIRMMGQFGLLHERLTGVDQRCGDLDERLTEHTTNHPPAKPSLARVGGISGIIAAIFTAAGALIGAILRRGW